MYDQCQHLVTDLSCKTHWFEPLSAKNNDQYQNLGTDLSCKTHWYEPLSLRTPECKTPDCKNPDEVRGRRLFGEGHLLERERLVEDIRYSIFVTFFPEQTSSYLGYLMNSFIWHREHSILRLLHHIVVLLIAKILLNYEFDLEILILVVSSYCGVSNMVSWRPLFINSYSNILLPVTYLFFIYFIPIFIKLSYAHFLAVMEKMQSNEALVSDVFFVQTWCLVY